MIYCLWGNLFIIFTARYYVFDRLYTLSYDSNTGLTLDYIIEPDFLNKN